MRHVCGVLLISVVACKQPAKPAPDPTQPAGSAAPVATPPIHGAASPQPAARTVVPCPTGDALTALARKVFAVPAGEHELEAQCATFFAGGKPLWIVDGAFQAELVELRTALVAAGGDQVLGIKTGASDEFPLADSYEVADLDGDGSDELLVKNTEGGHGHAYDVLHIHTWRDGKLAEVGTLALRYENTGAVSLGDEKKQKWCQAERKLVAGPAGTRRIDLVGKRKGIRDEDGCPLPGHHVYSFDGRSITEVAM